MLIDLLIFPLLSLILFATKYCLMYVGIASPLVFLTCFFAIFHLAITIFIRIKMKNYDDRVIPRQLVANASAFAVALTATITYIIIGAIPVLKAPFFLFKNIPSSQFWLDHLIVGIPTYIMFRLSDYITSGLLDDQPLPVI